jgi:hypothetical protein
MNYTTHNEAQERIQLGMSSLRGCIEVSYADLVKAFGEPMHEGFDDYKSDAEWNIVFEDGTKASIYNWKDGINYCGDEGTPTEFITDWHVGGYDEKAVQRVREVLDCVLVASLA